MFSKCGHSCFSRSQEAVIHSSPSGRGEDLHQLEGQENILLEEIESNEHKINPLPVIQ